MSIGMRPHRCAWRGRLGRAGVPPARTVVVLRRVVHYGPPALAGGTPVLPGTSRADLGSGCRDDGALRTPERDFA